MPFEHTPGLARALNRAGAWASQQSLAEITTWQLFQGLIEDEESQPSVLLVQAGLERTSLAEAFFPDALVPDNLEQAVPLARPTREILTHAQNLARGMTTEATLATDHVLLALLEMDQELRARLEALGLDFSQFQHTLHPTPPPIYLDEPLNLLEPPEEVNTARILDACANRSREALRVLEDHCRFVLGDALLSRELKELRHALVGLMNNFPERLLLEARDTLHDVGTTISTAQELERSSLDDVLQANARRLQEALRSLEEFSKVFSAELGQGFEQIRYRSYTLEKALLLGTAARDRLARARLYVLITGELCRASLVGTVAEAMAGGAHIIQLREKRLGDRALLDLARDVRKMTRAAGLLFIVNDRPDVARLAEADGVHLGQEDMSVAEARRIVGAGALIGVSTHNLEQVRRAVLEGASYLGVGPTFPSPTKAFKNFPGLDFVRQVAAETTLPAFVLGGVTLANLPEVLAAGGQRVAVSHAICAAADPRLVADKMARMLHAAAT